MDVEKTIEFILQQHARTEAMMEESHQRLEGSQTRLAQNLITLTDLVRQISEQNESDHQRFEELHRGADERIDALIRMSEQNERDHRRFEEFHREVDERFNVLIKMMDEWIRSQRNQNGRP